MIFVDWIMDTRTFPNAEVFKGRVAYMYKFQLDGDEFNTENMPCQGDIEIPIEMRNKSHNELIKYFRKEFFKSIPSMRYYL